MNGRRGVGGGIVLVQQVEGAGLFSSTSADNREREGEKEFRGEHPGCRLNLQMTSEGRGPRGLGRAYIWYACLKSLASDGILHDLRTKRAHAQLGAALHDGRR